MSCSAITDSEADKDWLGLDNALFERELEKVIRALRTDHAGREEPPSPRL